MYVIGIRGSKAGGIALCLTYITLEVLMAEEAISEFFGSVGVSCGYPLQKLLSCGY